MAAAASTRRMNETHKMLAFALLLVATLFHDGVAADDDEVLTASTPALETAAFIRGDMIEEEATLPTENTESETPGVQIIVYPSIPSFDLTELFPDQTAVPTVTEGDEAALTTDMATGEAETTTPQVDQPESETLVPQQVLTSLASDTVLIPEADVMCVDKEAVQDRDAISLKLKVSSSCEATRTKIQSVLEHLCGEDCKLEVYQEDNTNEILISGQYIEADAQGMANKFNNDNIKDKIDVEEAVPRWGKNSKVVLVSLLLTGLLLAALLIAGYYLKTQRGKSAKGIRLAESFQVDEENQANTLVSVAPLNPPEPQDKPTVNGETPEDGKSQPPPTNGHSATQTPVADTEM